MMSEESKGTRSLEQLPLELIQLILTELPDVSNLKSAALTGPCLYYAFMGAEVLITKEVLLRQIHTDLLHDALAEISSRRDTWTAEEAEVFLAQYFSRSQQPFHPSLQWKLSQALPLCRLYSLIELFTVDLTTPVLAGNPVSKDPESGPSPRPLSQTEKNRIIRNFYRFQIYCNIFRDESPPISVYRQRKSYFAHFAPWENEQLACIHDYLLNIITPGSTSLPFQVYVTHQCSNNQTVVKEVAESSRDWVLYFEEEGNGFDEGTMQYHLSLGLAHIRQFSNANTPQERHDLLAPSVNRYSIPYFLARGLDESNFGREPLFTLNSDEADRCIFNEWYSETDSGPEDVWRWSHYGQPEYEFVHSPSQAPLRQWSYVMWDRARLDEWGVFKKPWDGIVDENEYAEQERSQLAEERRIIETRFRDMLLDFERYGFWFYDS